MSQAFVEPDCLEILKTRVGNSLRRVDHVLEFVSDYAACALSHEGDRTWITASAAIRNDDAVRVWRKEVEQLTNVALSARPIPRRWIQIAREEESAHERTRITRLRHLVHLGCVQDDDVRVCIEVERVSEVGNVRRINEVVEFVGDRLIIRECE